MEKRSPHYALAQIKSLVQDGKVRATQAARSGANVLGLDFQAMLDVVMTLSPTDFYKSMTTHADHRIWQDVYHAVTPGGAEIYLKLTVMADVLIVSFKEL
jgi:motility quorum-sensing regulator/GCU-specific mRNA interferase toxin